MKVIRFLFSMILYVVLTAALLASVCLLALKQVTTEENVDRVLSEISTGEKALAFGKVNADEDLSFEDALKKYLPVQNATAISIYGDTARQATDAGIAAIADYTGGETAFTDFSEMADVFMDGYIGWLNENGKLRGSVSYMTQQYGRLWSTKERYCRDTVRDRLENDLKKIAEDGTAFGQLTLDGTTPIFYTALSRKQNADAQNAVYAALEKWYDESYRSYVKGLLNYCLKGGNVTGVAVLTKEEILDLFLSETGKNGVRGSLLSDERIRSEILRQAEESIVPRLKPAISVPYAALVGADDDPALVWTRRVFAIEPLIPCAALCGFLLLLLLLIGHRPGVFFGALSALTSACALLALPLFRSRAFTEAAPFIPAHLTENGIPEKAADLFLGSVKVYIPYLLIGGGALLLIWLICLAISGIPKKKEKQTQA